VIGGGYGTGLELAYFPFVVLIVAVFSAAAVALGAAVSS